MMIRCVMALIRGLNSLYPCPRCLVLGENLDNPTNKAPPRTTEGTKATIKRAREQERLGERDNVLKNAGLQDVDVCFNSCYSHMISALVTFFTEYILEDSKLGPTCCADIM